jgi:4-hydroxy-tetrahydrodipicolinate reductase
MTDLNIGVVGAGGRMGRMLVEAIATTDGARLAAASEAPGADTLGADAGVLAGVGQLDVALTDDASSVFDAADAVIDFTAPAATVAHAELAAAHGTALVVGTTGLDGDQEAQLRAAGDRTAIVWAPNMSLGVNLLFALTEQVARALADDWDIEIVEMHHKHKVDAPSGTALGLGQAAARGRGVDLDAVSQRVRDGQTGPRRQGDIGFATLRGGDVFGDHSVIFATEGERVELTHKVSTRAVFARGAVRAALWTRGREPGLYSMFDVLGLAR